jgi:hypothetical protein
MRPEDTGAIAVTGSHAALFRGQPDGVVSVDLTGVFFSDGGIGLDNAGITRLADLDQRRMPAGAAAAASAAIGNSRQIHAEGVLSSVNETARERGILPGMAVRDAVERLVRGR